MYSCMIWLLWKQILIKAIYETNSTSFKMPAVFWNLTIDLTKIKLWKQISRGKAKTNLQSEKNCWFFSYQILYDSYGEESACNAGDPG